MEKKVQGFRGGDDPVAKPPPMLPIHKKPAGRVGAEKELGVKWGEVLAKLGMEVEPGGE
jgi:hypothetical protein